MDPQKKAHGAGGRPPGRSAKRFFGKRFDLGRGPRASHTSLFHRKGGQAPKGAARIAKKGRNT